MTALVADVGGTNSRLALIGADGAPGRIHRYANRDFARFEEVIARFVAKAAPPPIHACAVAVAGPVTDGQARLTNRDWVFDAGQIAGALPGGPAVRLVNDLAALGHALDGLAPGQIDLLRAGAQGRSGNGQRLVVGLGTGVNVCLVAPGPAVIEAELGHASLPSSVAAALGGRAADFPTCEDLFSGRGLPRLHGQGAEDAAAVVEAAHSRQQPDAAGSVARLAGLLGVLTRELVYQYMPLDGIFFAGSVARGVLGPSGRAAFLEAAAPAGPFAELIARVPLRLITDDGAALVGLSRLVTHRPAA